ncbi:MAG TPA: ABC transporter permease [Gemmataceae bacterium]|jgi:ABC-type transport system involved in multi-copper enzyme maturation permease subunit|nr:ABC transporter permease [Gemmataceae bacterium]
MSSETFTGAPEQAPSAMSEDQASTARTIGLTGLMAVVLGTLVLILNAANARLPLELGNNVGFAGIVIGIALMFYHASRDNDQLVRRLYGYVGGLGLPLSGLILSLLPVIISCARPAPDDGPKVIVSLFFPFGWACFLAGLFFLIPFCKNEPEEDHRRYGVLGLGGIGAGLALTGLIGGLAAGSFALTYGVVLSLLGLAYLCAYINQVGGAELDGYRPALAMAGVGVLVFAIALIRSCVGGDRPYFVPTGLVMISLGLSYAIAALFMVSDLTIIVLTRRELLAYFCSPIAYLLLFLSALVAAATYNEFVDQLASTNNVLLEPIVLYFYLGGLYAAFMLVFQIPALTMRMFAEEKRTGTYEVLMCAPVSETPVVLSKLIASLAFYMLIWAVWLIFLLDIRVESGKAFDYRPLISFYLVLAVNGAAFLAMGIFFSSLTRNQIVAAALTFVGMIGWLAPYFIIRGQPENTTKFLVLKHLSFVNLWVESLQGQLHLRELILQGSVVVFWVFLTVKVLEARRWS